MRERFDVTWYSSIPKDKNGDSDMDRAVDEYRTFPSEAEASAFALSVAASAVFGYATVQRAVAITRGEALASEDGDVFKDKRGQWWEYVGESREVGA